jgi:hypothetical protein
LRACADGKHHARGGDGLKNLACIQEHPSISSKEKVGDEKSEKAVRSDLFSQAWYRYLNTAC